MHMSLKGIVAGTLALVGATVAVTDAQAMPVQPLSAAVASSAPLEHVYYYGYGYRRPFVRPFIRPFVRRRFFYRRPFVRPFVRPFYGYRRPYYGYGYRRF